MKTCTFYMAMSIVVAFVLALSQAAVAQCCNGMCPATRAGKVLGLPSPAYRAVEVLPQANPETEYARATSILGGQDVVPGYQPATMPTIAPQPLWYVVTPAGLVPMYTQPGYSPQLDYSYSRTYDPWINADPYQRYYGQAYRSMGYGPSLMERIMLGRAARARAASGGAKAK